MSVHEITIFHSPDADDAFMFYGLTSGKIASPGYTFRHELSDIETLNQRARRGEIDCTAVSVHAFSHLAKDYIILNSGASMGGKDYGPRLVATSALDLADGKRRCIGVPGELTSATLALKIFLHENRIDADLKNLGFDQVQHAVKDGSIDAGVIIHEGQLTHKTMGLECVLDLGAWWWEKTSGLPLPLGINVVRRSLGAEAIQATAQVLHGTIAYSLAHRSEALDYALSYGRGISRGDADKFVGWYVNERTLDLGAEGRRSIQQFLGLGAKYGFCPAVDAQAMFAV